METEPKRNHLIVSYTCPFAHRAILARHLFGLDGPSGVDQVAVSPLRLDDKWAFQESIELGTAGADPLFPSAKFLADIYQCSPPPNWDKSNSVPLLIDSETKQSVSQSSAEIVWRFANLNGAKIPENFSLTPAWNAPEVEQLTKQYIGFLGPAFRSARSKTQEEFDQFADQVVKAFDAFENRLASSKFVMGENPSGVDLLLWPFYVRWDVSMMFVSRIYISHRVSYPNITRWIRAVAALDDGKLGRSFNHKANELSIAQGVHGLYLFLDKNQQLCPKISPWEFSS